MAKSNRRNESSKKSIESELKELRKERKVEAALEKIRKRALFMRDSKEIEDVVVVMKREMGKLGQPGLFASVIHLLPKGSKSIESWSAFSFKEGRKEKSSFVKSFIPINSARLVKKIVRFHRSKKKELSLKASYEELKEWYRVRRKLMPAASKKIGRAPKVLFYQASKFSEGYLLMVSNDPPSDKAKSLLKKAAATFDLAYKRYKDLKKAEAQAREAEIEVALEKIRASAMGMRAPEEIAEVTDILREQMRILGQPELESAFVVLYDEERNEEEEWFAFRPPKSKKKILKGRIKWRLDENEILKTLFRIYKSGAREKTFIARGKDLKLLQNQLFKKFPEFKKYFPGKLPDSIIHHVTRFSKGHLLITSYEELSEESKQLQKRVTEIFDLAYRRFLDLRKAEAQAREAEVQLALERVRARTMAMQKSEELSETVVKLFNEFVSLGYSLDRFGIGIFNEESGYQTIWTTTPDGKSLNQENRISLSEKTTIQKSYKAWKAGKKRLIVDLKGSELKYWFDYVIKEHSIPVDRSITRRVHNFAFFSNGWLDLLSSNPVEERDFDLLTRFATVFDQTYTRFLDLKRAEAQAREAQIEAALEKVRSRSLALQKSVELTEVVAVLLEQLQSIGIDAYMSMIVLLDKETKEYDVLMSSDVQSVLPQIYHVPNFNNAFRRKFLAAFEENIPFKVFEFGGKTKKDFDKLAFKVTDFAKLPAESKKMMKSLERASLSCAYMSYGCIEAIGEKPLSDEDAKILQRFAKVFEQAYTRFLDIQNAEKQAREAEIETALERIRSRSLAMHESKELHEVIQVVFDQFAALNIPLDSCYVNIYQEKGNRDLNFYVAAGGQLYPEFITTPYRNTKEFNLQQDALKMKKSFYSYCLTKKQTDSWWHHFLSKSINVKVTSKRKSYLYRSPGLCVSVALGKHASIHILNYNNRPFRQDENAVLRRISKAFEQTYTRFLDLQNAETQAREAEIELALERVRARSMAMQNSSELKDVIQVIFEQIRSLDINAEHAGIVVDFEPWGDFHFWVADEQDIPSQLTIPYLDSGWDRQFNEAKEEGIDFFTSQWDFKDKNRFYRKLLPHIPGLTKKARDFYMNCPGLAGSTVVEKDIGLYIENFSGIPYSDQDNSILKRFGKVFQQSYIRFLDLKRAEEQAREAQIETALERVRARSNAMHKSNELTDVAAVIFEQMEELGIKPYRCGFTRLNLEKDYYDVWNYTELPSGSKTHHEGWISYKGNKYVRNAHKFFSEKDYGIYSYDLVGKQLSDYLEHASKGFATPESRLKSNRPKRLVYYHCGYNMGTDSQGSVYAVFTSPLPENYQEILIRFTGAFQQAYTRFEDLRRAEAQAREAEIEASLERVRARTMGMHHSNELQEVIIMIFNEIVGLGIDIDVSFISTDMPKDRSKGVNIWVSNKDQTYAQEVHLPYNDSSVYHSLFDAWFSKKKLNAYVLPKEEKDKFFKFLFKKSPDLIKIPDERKKFILKGTGWSASHMRLKNGSLTIQRYNMKPFTEEEIAVQVRFGNMFEQTYTRFLDLQRAEAQAREAEIEAALERVRAKAMAMHNSEDLAETIKVFYEQIGLLGENPRRCGIDLIDKESQTVHISSMNTSEKGESIEAIGSMKLKGHRVLRGIYNHWVKQEEYFPVLKGKEIKEYYDFVRPHVGYPDYKKDEAHYGHFFSFSEGCIYVWTTQKMPEDQLAIYRRFTSVLSLTYRRYRDLREAEAQAREAQIETALEKVRSRSLAMHDSSELQEVAHNVFKQLTELGLELDSTAINMFKAEDEVTFWIATPTYLYPTSMDLKLFNTPLLNDMLKVRKKKGAFFSYTYSKKDKDAFYRLAFKHGFRNIPESRRKIIFSGEALTVSVAFNKHTAIQLIRFTKEPYSESDNEILRRFANVFEQAYVRFLDLKKAEAQAREAEIEASLERVRARSMAMHKSDDLSEVAVILYKEFVSLGVPNIFNCGYVDVDLENEIQRAWVTNPDGSNLQQMNLPLEGDWVMDSRFASWKKKEPVFCQVVGGKKLKKHLEFVLPHLGVDQKSMVISQFPETVYFYCGNFQHGYLHLLATAPIDKDNESIFTRFTGVFEQTYTRFLDLKRAEEQAREAEIEAALERVRAQAMAMQKPEDMIETCKVISDQLGVLNVDQIRNVQTAIIDVEKNTFINYEYFTQYEKSSIKEMDIDSHPTVRAFANQVSQSPDAMFATEIKGKELKDWIKFRKNTKQISDPYLNKAKSLHYSFHSIGNGALGISAYVALTEEQLNIFKRFRNVFNLAYQRFVDLQKAEASAAEAIRQASLDRVRAEIASMRTVKDLERITPIIWKELGVLNIPFIRCGVFIVDEKNKILQTHLSTPDGQAITAFDLPIDSPGKVALIYENWVKGLPYLDHWSKEDFTEFAHTLEKQGALPSAKDYLETLPKKGFHLHFLPFLQGMLYVGSDQHLGDEDLRLIQSLAEAFSTAYARYEDFTMLEEAKRSIEKSLTELRAAQNQLVQSEKMASLGELTAGIAHEIKNPLNFVNNFSEVSGELIDELNEAIANGDIEEVKAIAVDIKQNLEKILHHGNRADGIVKSMLQHSRSGSGEKELTDVNILADEYLRLAYHGLRAKDKSFNAAMEADLDTSLEKIAIVPQDIGRVMLNLITNAFYAVTEKNANAQKEYSPKVIVSTASVNGMVEIRVKDNGKGIPRKVKDKIFQPFFTTKPTGQGTGLGLSLSYDIVKAHGGELKMETKVGKGTEFIVQLPKD